MEIGIELSPISSLKKYAKSKLSKRENIDENADCLYLLLISNITPTGPAQHKKI